MSREYIVIFSMFDFARFGLTLVHYYRFSVEFPEAAPWQHADVDHQLPGQTSAFEDRSRTVISNPLFAARQGTMPSSAPKLEVRGVNI